MKNLLPILFLLLTAPASAVVTITFLEPGTDATQGTQFFSSITGTGASSATDQIYTGPRSLKITTGSPAAQTVLRRGGILGDGGRRISFRYRFDATPAVANSSFLIRDSGDNGIASIVHNTNNTLSVAGATAANGTKVLSANTWYRLALSYTITDVNTFRFQLYINGVPEANMISGSIARTGSDLVRFLVAGSWGTNVNVWIDDIYIDNGNDYTDPGDIRVTAKLPFSNGTMNGFTGSGTPSGYGSGNAGYVNERPLNTTNLVSVVAAGVTTEEYNIENQAVGDVNLNGQQIMGLCGWLYAKALLAETASMVLNNATSSVALTSSDTMFQNCAATPAAYPAGTGTDIGLTTTALATTVTLYEAGVLVAYRYPGYFLGNQ